MPDLDREALLFRIKAGKCTPFLGAGATHGLIDGADRIASCWAKAEGYPLRECDLQRVTQFLAIRGGDATVPKDKMCSYIESSLKAVDVKEWLARPDNPVAILASLPLPVYITTNYDDLMMTALESAGKKPRLELCRWNRAVAGLESVFDRKSRFAPTPETPLVYHLHGHVSMPDSLVLTEDDYVDFLVNLAKDENLLPPRVKEAIAGSSLLFVGYKLADINFRVLFRGLLSSMEGVLRKVSIAVQLPPDGYSEDELGNVRAYLASYFEKTNVKVHWSDASLFLAELKEQWKEFRQ